MEQGSRPKSSSSSSRERRQGKRVGRNKKRNRRKEKIRTLGANRGMLTNECNEDVWWHFVAQIWGLLYHWCHGRFVMEQSTASGAPEDCGPRGGWFSVSSFSGDGLANKNEGDREGQRGTVSERGWLERNVGRESRGRKGQMCKK